MHEITVKQALKGDTVKDQELQRHMKKYQDQIVELETYLKKIQYQDTEDPNAMCSRLSQMNGIISRATVIAAYFDAVYEKTFSVMKYSARKQGERLADSYACGETADLKEITGRAQGLLKAIDRISANYGKILEYRQHELMAGMGKRDGSR